MIKRYLDSYKNFKCIADKCPATCCSGWQIEIDEETLIHYEEEAKKQTGELYARNIDWQQACFKQKANGDCAFLKENGLCEMILTYGEEHLCKTCDQYPRHTEEFLNAREYSLSVSCPVVAKELVEKQTYLSVEEETTEEKDDISEFEDFNSFLYLELLQCRTEVFGIIQDEALNFDEKCQKILKYMRDTQDYIDGFDPDLSDEAEKGVDLYRKELFDLLFELEPLQENFREELEAMGLLLFGEDEDPEYIKTMKEYFTQFEKEHENWQLQCENLMMYFIYTYMCGAVYDDYVFAMAAQAVYNACMIKLLWVAEYVKKGAPLTTEEQANLVYHYSRELEHSNENMILLEQLLDETM